MTDAVTIGVFVLRTALLVALLESIRRRNVAAAVNTTVALLAAVLPDVVELVVLDDAATGVHFPPALSFWIAAAGFLHALGMLGLYDATRWWDHVTHAVSAGLVAALIYAGLSVSVAVADDVLPLPGGVVGTTVLYTMAVGVFWELIELAGRDAAERLGIEPILVHYGWRDTVLDLAFDLVGAVLVVTLYPEAFVALAEQFPRTTVAVVTWSGWLFVVGALALMLGLVLGSDRAPGSG